jgi:hypothetical protein
VTCAAVLLALLYWTDALSQLPHQLISPEPPGDDATGPAFVVRDLPGRGKGMIALRNIRVGIRVIWVQLTDSYDMAVRD